MCKIMEEFAAEERAEAMAIQAEEFAMKLLEDGVYSVSKISEISKLPESKVRELAEKLQPAAK